MRLVSLMRLSLALALVVVFAGAAVAARVVTAILRTCTWLLDHFQ